MPLGFSADLQPSDPVLNLRVCCGNLGMNPKANIAVFQNSRHWHSWVCILFRESNCSEVKTEHLSHRFLPTFCHFPGSGYDHREILGNPSLSEQCKKAQVSTPKLLH